MPEVPDSILMVELGDSLDQDTFNEYLRVLDRALEGKQAFAMVVDGSSPPLALNCTPNRRWQLQRAAACSKLHRGIAFVTGTMTRERMQALHAMQVPGVAYAYLPTRDEALAWARGHVDGNREEMENDRKTVPFMPAAR